MLIKHKIKSDQNNWLLSRNICFQVLIDSLDWFIGPEIANIDFYIERFLCCFIYCTRW